MDSNCNYIVGGGVPAYCYLNTGVSFPKYMIFYANMIISLSGGKNPPGI